MFRISAGGLDETKYFNRELYSCVVDGNRILHVMAFNKAEAMMSDDCMEDFDRLVDEFHNAKSCFISSLAGADMQLDLLHGCHHLHEKG